MSLVISLTTIPSRFDKLTPVLEALLAQTADVAEIRLHVPKRYRRFPDYAGDLPRVPKGIRIVQPADDLGPASKVLYTAHDLRGSDCDIIYCDDDRIYPADWFARMLAQRAERLDHALATSILELPSLRAQSANELKPRATPHNVFPSTQWAFTKRKLKQMLTGVADPKPHRTMRSGYADIAAGFGAVLVRPDFFDSAAYDIPPVLWSVDDVWLSGQMAKNGIPIWCGHGFLEPSHSDASEVDALYASVFDDANRSEANTACVRYMQDTYGIWR